MTTRPDTLTRVALVYLAANVLHGLDHERQGTARLTPEVLAGGAVLTFLAVLAVALAWRRRPRAPVACAVIGLLSAAGVAASHIAPHWSAFSDSYPQVGADAGSWVVMLAEVGAALALGLAGLAALGGRAPGHESASHAGLSGS